MKTYYSLAVTAFLTCKLLQSLSASESEWPQWRGPNRDGCAADTGLLQEWPKEGPPLLWKATPFYLRNQDVLLCYNLL